MKPRLLDLFCGAGGCSVGYVRAGFEVVGVDIELQPNYPYPFWQGDALEVNVDGFDAVHASPPCQAHSAVTGKHRDNHVDLVPDIRRMLSATGLPYIIENVVGAPLIDPVQLCGSGFGLPLRRHRLFETNFPLMAPGCAHGALPKRFKHFRHGKVIPTPFVPVYGTGGGKAREHWAEAMGIDWMTADEMAQAIPPVYTEHIGGYLARHVAKTGRDALTERV